MIETISVLAINIEGGITELFRPGFSIKLGFKNTDLG